MIPDPRRTTAAAWARLIPPVLLVLTAPPALSHSRTYVVNRGHAVAADANPGTKESPLRTISRAAALARPGDIVLVHAGTYRERVAPARGGLPGQPIVYMAAPMETVVIKGSIVWRPQWQKLSQDQPIYRGTLDAAIFQGLRIHPYRTLLKQAPGGRRLTLGQVFVDGQQLQQVDNDRALAGVPATWLAGERGNTLSLHFPGDSPAPARRLVEITVRDRIFAPHARGLGYLHVKGFTMEHCANQFPDRFWLSDSPQAGALGARAGHHWLIEDNTVRFARSIGIDCGYEGKHDLEGVQATTGNSGYHLIRNNRVTDNGCCGIAGMRSTGTRIIGNVVERNNWNRHTAPEAAGIKLHFFVDGLIERNLVRDNYAHGIWLDNVFRNARVTRNLVVANRGNGIYVELEAGPVLIDNNVIASTMSGVNPRDPRGDGLYSHDASRIHFVHNLVLGSERFGAFHRKVTARKGAAASQIILLNNLFVNNRAGHLNLPYPGPDAQGNRSDHNLFSPHGHFVVNHWGGHDGESIVRLVQQKLGHALTLWNDVAPQVTFAEWQRVMEMDRHSVQTDSVAAAINADLVLQWKGGALPPLVTSRWDGLDRDFLGELMPISGARAGPFQGRTNGRHEILLWP